MGIRLGPFELGEIVGSGGMATVWRARHHGGRVVAVKVVRAGEPGDDARRAERFAGEIRAVARLRHPCIVHVFDAGTVDRDAAAASGGTLREGAPWLAMEHASAGSLDRLRAVPTWPVVKGLALALLDALAHAHARGIVHRDLKPANVLIAGARDLRPGPKLSDFGLAAVGASHSASRRAGTLAYMAPEQIRGDWREFGPWTDLYAFGGVIWRLVSGRNVHGDLTGPDLARAHLELAPGDLRARIPVPFGFRQWLDALLAKDPAQRTPLAADAARSLLDLGDPADVPTRGIPLAAHHTMFVPGDRTPADPALVLPEQTTLLWAPEPPVDARPPVDEPVMSGLPGWSVARASDTFPSWRRPSEPAPPRALADAGLTLLGAREIALVGRDAEQDALWEAARRARSDGPRAVIVRGTRGTGRTRLAHWIARRAHELGVAEVVRARCHRGATPGETVRRVVSTVVGTEGLSRADMERRLVRLLSPDRVPDVLSLLAPGRRTPQGPAARHACAVRVLDDRASRGLVLVVLDDLQGDPDAVAWVRRILEGAARPVLVVGTVRDGSLAEHPDRQAAVDALGTHPRAEVLELGPLAPTAATSLVQQLLHLEPGLARWVADRTGGNPRFAVDLVRSWALGGLLESRPHGFGLKSDVELPATLEHLWTAEVDLGLRAVAEPVRVDLERASCMADPVPRAALDALAVSPADDRARALAQLAVRALVDGDADHVRFRNPYLRVALQARASAGGRLVGHHRACASWVEQARPYDREALGTHLLAAREPDAAWPHLMAAVRSRRGTVGYPAALALLREADAALDAAGASPLDPRRTDAVLLRGTLRRLQGAYAEALDVLAPAEEACRQRGDAPRLVPVLVERATCAIHLGDLETASTLLKEAASIGRAAGDQVALGAVRFTQAVVAGARQEPAVALVLLDRALALYGSRGHPAEADVLRERATQLGALGRDDEARASLEQAMERYAARGSGFGVGQCHNELAEIARRRGDLEAAEAGYREAWSVLSRIGDAGAVVPLLNLGVVRIRHGDLVGSLEPLREAREQARRQGHVRLVAGADAVLLPGLAAVGDWAAWDAALEDALTACARYGLAEPDMAWAAERGADEAAVAGHVGRANRALGLAHDQWRRLGRSEADRVAARIAAG